MLAPRGWSHINAATLPCAAVTAWNALDGLKKGQSVLVQGTGGVSLFGLQFAKMRGAFVIATTSSGEKEQALRNLGADMVINYHEISEWGEEAKSRAPGGEGVDYVLEIGGISTFAQSLKAVKMEGVVSMIGYRGGEGEGGPRWSELLERLCSVRGIFVGSRSCAQEMLTAVEDAGMRPVLDGRVWDFEEAPQVLVEFEKGGHFGKVVIRIGDEE
jgi:NADPH:quinone reductase-like Zn-dependent oxidoreductase